MHIATSAKAHLDNLPPKCCCSVAKVMSNSLRPPWLYYARIPCLSLSPRVCSNPCPLSWWCHLTISSSVCPFSFCFQPFPASRSFLMSQFFTWGGQSIGASVSASVLPINIQVLFPLWLTGLISLQSKLQESSSVPQVKSISSPHLAFLMVQFLYPFMTTGKTTALTVWIFVGKDADIICLCFFICCLFRHSFPSKEQVYFNFMASVSICSDFWAQESKICHCFPFICHEVIGPDAMILVFLNVEFYDRFSLSSFNFIKRLFSFSSLSAIRVISPAYMRLLIFLLAILIPTCNTSSPAFHIMYSA